MNMRRHKRNGNDAFLLFLVITAVFFIVSIITETKVKAEEITGSIPLPVARVIEADIGGSIGDYYRKAESLKGTKVIIDGMCLSACTMLLRTDFDLDVCVTDRAVFGFHKPYRLVVGTNIPLRDIKDRPMSNRMWGQEFYTRMPENIVDYLRDQKIPSVNDGDGPNEFLLYYGGGLPACEDRWWTKYDLEFEAR